MVLKERKKKSITHNNPTVIEKESVRLSRNHLIHLHKILATPTPTLSFPLLK